MLIAVLVLISNAMCSTLVAVNIRSALAIAILLLLFMVYLVR